MKLNLRDAFVAALVVTSTLTAQFSKTGTFSRGIGNRWLGGNVSITAALNTTTASGAAMTTTRTANASVTAAADADILTFRLRAAELTASASNSVRQSNFTAPQQRATATFRLTLAGRIVLDRSATSTGNLGGIPATTFNLFPQDVSVPVPVGPFTIRLGGNAGVTLQAAALVIFPTTAPEVGLTLSGNSAVVGRAFVSVGALGFAAGLELRGTFAEQRLLFSLIANALNGLSGISSYDLRAISLQLVAFLEAFGVRVHTNTLTRWGSAAVSLPLLNL